MNAFARTVDEDNVTDLKLDIAPWLQVPSFSFILRIITSAGVAQQKELRHVSAVIDNSAEVVEHQCSDLRNANNQQKSGELEMREIIQSPQDLGNDRRLISGT